MREFNSLSREKLSEFAKLTLKLAEINAEPQKTAIVTFQSAQKEYFDVLAKVDETEDHRLIGRVYKLEAAYQSARKNLNQAI